MEEKGNSSRRQRPLPYDKDNSVGETNIHALPPFIQSPSSVPLRVPISRSAAKTSHHSTPVSGSALRPMNETSLGAEGEEEKSHRSTTTSQQSVAAPLPTSLHALPATSQLYSGRSGVSHSLPSNSGKREMGFIQSGRDTEGEPHGSFSRQLSRRESTVPPPAPAALPPPLPFSSSSSLPGPGEEGTELRSPAEHRKRNMLGGEEASTTSTGGSGGGRGGPPATTNSSFCNSMMEWKAKREGRNPRSRLETSSPLGTGRLGGPREKNASADTPEEEKEEDHHPATVPHSQPYLRSTVDGKEEKPTLRRPESKSTALPLSGNRPSRRSGEKEERDRPGRDVEGGGPVRSFPHSVFLTTPSGQEDGISMHFAATPESLQEKTPSHAPFPQRPHSRSGGEGSASPSSSAKPPDKPGRSSEGFEEGPRRRNEGEERLVRRRNLPTPLKTPDSRATAAEPLPRRERGQRHGGTHPLSKEEKEEEEEEGQAVPRRQGRLPRTRRSDSSGESSSSGRDSKDGSDSHRDRPNESLRSSGKEQTTAKLLQPASDRRSTQYPQGRQPSHLDEIGNTGGRGSLLFRTAKPPSSLPPPLPLRPPSQAKLPQEMLSGSTDGKKRISGETPQEVKQPTREDGEERPRPRRGRREHVKDAPEQLEDPHPNAQRGSGQSPSSSDSPSSSTSSPCLRTPKRSSKHSTTAGVTSFSFHVSPPGASPSSSVDALLPPSTRTASTVGTTAVAAAIAITADQNTETRSRVPSQGEGPGKAASAGAWGRNSDVTSTRHHFLRVTRKGGAAIATNAPPSRPLPLVSSTPHLGENDSTSPLLTSPGLSSEPGDRKGDEEDAGTTQPSATLPQVRGTSPMNPIKGLAPPLDRLVGMGDLNTSIGGASASRTRIGSPSIQDGTRRNTPAADEAGEEKRLPGTAVAEGPLGNEKSGLPPLLVPLVPKRPSTSSSTTTAAATGDDTTSSRGVHGTTGLRGLPAVSTTTTTNVLPSRREEKMSEESPPPPLSTSLGSSSTPAEPAPTTPLSTPLPPTGYPSDASFSLPMRRSTTFPQPFSEERKEEEDEERESDAEKTREDQRRAPAEEEEAPPVNRTPTDRPRSSSALGHAITTATASPATAAVAVRAAAAAGGGTSWSSSTTTLSGRSSPSPFPVSAHRWSSPSHSSASPGVSSPPPPCLVSSPPLSTLPRVFAPPSHSTNSASSSFSPSSSAHPSEEKPGQGSSGEQGMDQKGRLEAAAPWKVTQSPLKTKKEEDDSASSLASSSSPAPVPPPSTLEERVTLPAPPPTIAVSPSTAVMGPVRVPTPVLPLPGPSNPPPNASGSGITSWNSLMASSPQPLPGGGGGMGSGSSSASGAPHGPSSSSPAHVGGSPTGVHPPLHPSQLPATIHTNQPMSSSASTPSFSSPFSQHPPMAAPFFPPPAVMAEIMAGFQRFILRLPGRWIKPVLRALALQVLTENAPLLSISSQSIRNAYLDLMGEALHTRPWCREDAGALCAATSYVAYSTAATGIPTGASPYPGPGGVSVNGGGTGGGLPVVSASVSSSAPPAMGLRGQVSWGGGGAGVNGAGITAGNSFSSAIYSGAPYASSLYSQAVPANSSSSVFPPTLPMTVGLGGTCANTGVPCSGVPPSKIAPASPAPSSLAMMPTPGPALTIPNSPSLLPPLSSSSVMGKGSASMMFTLSGGGGGRSSSSPGMSNTNTHTSGGVPSSSTTSGEVVEGGGANGGGAVMWMMVPTPAPVMITTTLDTASEPRVNLLYLACVSASLLRFHTFTLRQSIFSNCRRSIEKRLREEIYQLQQQQLQAAAASGGGHGASSAQALANGKRGAVLPSLLSPTEMAIAVTKQLNRGLAFGAHLSQQIPRPLFLGSRLFLPPATTGVASASMASLRANESVTHTMNSNVNPTSLGDSPSRSNNASGDSTCMLSSKGGNSVNLSVPGNPSHLSSSTSTSVATALASPILGNTSGEEYVDTRHQFASVSFEIMPSIFLKFKTEQRRIRQQQQKEASSPSSRQKREKEREASTGQRSSPGNTHTTLASNENPIVNSALAFARTTPYFQAEFISVFALGHPSSVLFASTLAPEFFVGMTTFLTAPLRALNSSLKATLHRLNNVVTMELMGIPVPREVCPRLRAPPLELSLLYIRESRVYFASTPRIAAKLFVATGPDAFVVIPLEEDNTNPIEMASGTMEGNLGYSITTSPPLGDGGGMGGGNVSSTSCTSSTSGVYPSHSLPPLPSSLPPPRSSHGRHQRFRRRHSTSPSGATAMVSAGAYDMPPIKVCTADLKVLCQDPRHLPPTGSTAVPKPSSSSAATGGETSSSRCSPVNAPPDPLNNTTTSCGENEGLEGTVEAKGVSPAPFPGPPSHSSAANASAGGLKIGLRAGTAGMASPLLNLPSRMAGGEGLSGGTTARPGGERDGGEEGTRDRETATHSTSQPRSGEPSPSPPKSTPTLVSVPSYFSTSLVHVIVTGGEEFWDVMEAATVGRYLLLLKAMDDLAVRLPSELRRLIQQAVSSPSGHRSQGGRGGGKTDGSTTSAEADGLAVSTSSSLYFRHAFLTLMDGKQTEARHFLQFHGEGWMSPDTLQRLMIFFIHRIQFYLFVLPHQVHSNTNTTSSGVSANNGGSAGASEEEEEQRWKAIFASYEAEYECLLLQSCMGPYLEPLSSLSASFAQQATYKKQAEGISSLPLGTTPLSPTAGGTHPSTRSTVPMEMTDGMGNLPIVMQGRTLAKDCYASFSGAVSWWLAVEATVIEEKILRCRNRRGRVGSTEKLYGTSGGGGGMGIARSNAGVANSTDSSTVTTSQYISGRGGAGLGVAGTTTHGIGRSSPTADGTSPMASSFSPGSSGAGSSGSSAGAWSKGSGSPFGSVKSEKWMGGTLQASASLPGTSNPGKETENNAGVAPLPYCPPGETKFSLTVLQLIPHRRLQKPMK